MAKVHIKMGAAVQVGGSSVFPAVPRAVQTMTSSGTSAASTITAQQGETASITVTGGDVFIATGSATPVAASGSGHLIPSGGSLDIALMQPGWAIAVIDSV